MNCLLELIKKPKLCENTIGFSLSKKHIDIIVAIIKSYNFGFTLEDKDIIQDLLIKLIQNYSYFDYSIEKINKYTIPYLNLITHRLCKDKYKYEKRRVHENIELPKYFNSVFMDTQTKQEAELDLIFFLNQLPKKYRIVVELNFQGYSHNEIAKKIDISTEVSRKRLQRARSILKRNHKKIIISNNV